jgi:hypothetical protein
MTKEKTSKESKHCCHGGNLVEHGFKLGFGMFLGFALGSLLVVGVATAIYYLVGLI